METRPAQGHARPPGGVSRRRLLELAAAAGAGAWLTACGSSGGDATSATTAAASGGGAGSTAPPATTISRPAIASEPGVLTIMEYSGYEVPDLFKAYVAQYPKPKFAFFATPNEAIAKVGGGYRADLVHGISGYVEDWVSSGAVQPWDTSLIPNFEHLNPNLTKAGQIGSDQYLIPLDWGFDAPMYREDKVEPRDNSWSILYDDRYSGKISWWDDLENVPINALVQALPGDPFVLASDQLPRVQSDLIAKKPVARNFWSTQNTIDQDWAAGNVWIAYAWGLSYVLAKKAKIPVVYMDPKEGRTAWVAGLLLMKETENYYHAHAYADAWASAETGKWLLENYAYGHANTTVDLANVNKDLVKVFKLDDPDSLKEPVSHFWRYTPQSRADYTTVWSAVKSAES